VDNHVVELEVDHEAEPTTGVARQEKKESDNKEKRDAEPSTGTPIDKDLPRSFIPRLHILRD
jgi:hypothetical protein